MIAVAKAMQALTPAGFKCYLFKPKMSSPPALSDYPYVFLWGSPGDRLSGDGNTDSLCDSFQAERAEVKATYVALNDTSLHILIQAFRDAWDRKDLTVEGFAPSRLKQFSLMDSEADSQAVLVNGIRPIYAVDQYTFIGSRI